MSGNSNVQPKALPEIVKLQERIKNQIHNDQRRNDEFSPTNITSGGS
jgi:hypothetical protein